MKAFPFWRAAGRAMRWARQHKIQVNRQVLDCKPHGDLVDHRWKSNDAALTLSGATWRTPSFEAFISAPVGYVEVSNPDAGQVLRVLAALDLIPADLAAAEDTAYGRCETCGRVCFWDDGAGLWTPRWIHLKALQAWGDAGPHLPVVTR